jgi:hypothetical protein
MDKLLETVAANWFWVFLFLLIFGGGIAGAVGGGIKYLIGEWRRARHWQQENELKRDMIAKGFSPEDIQRVIQASALGVNDAAASVGKPAKPRPNLTSQGTHVGSQRTVLVTSLAEHGWDAADIEQVLHAVGEDSRHDGMVVALAEQGWDAAGIERVLQVLGKDPNHDAMVLSLAEQGWDAADIERVLRAFHQCPAEVVAAKVAAVQGMAEQGMDAAGIERVIQAFGQPPVPGQPRGAGDTSFKV